MCAPSNSFTVQVPHEQAMEKEVHCSRTAAVRPQGRSPVCPSRYMRASRQRKPIPWSASSASDVKEMKDKDNMVRVMDAVFARMQSPDERELSSFMTTHLGGVDAVLKDDTLHKKLIEKQRSIGDRDAKGDTDSKRSRGRIGSLTVGDLREGDRPRCGPGCRTESILRTEVRFDACAYRRAQEFGGELEEHGSSDRGLWEWTTQSNQ